VPVDIVWKRRQDDTTWICGVAPRDEAQRQWESLLEYLRSAG